jgi:SAM-dependent methyltransferase
MPIRYLPTGAEAELGRLAAYQYLGELVAGRRVLEIGCGHGRALELFLALKAARLVGLDPDLQAAESRLSEAPGDLVSLRPLRGPHLPLLAGESFDLIVISDLRLVQATPALIEEVLGVLASEGLVICWAPSGDHPEIDGGLTYGELLDLLEPRFGSVRVIGQAPVFAYGLVELAPAATEAPDLSVDGTLLGGQSEAVVAYLVVCSRSPTAGPELDFGLVQVPIGGLDALPPLVPRERPGETAEPEADGTTSAEETPEPGQPAEMTPTSTPPPAEGPKPEVGGLTDQSGGLLSRWSWPGIFR